MVIFAAAFTPVVDLVAFGMIKKKKNRAEVPNNMRREVDRSGTNSCMKELSNVYEVLIQARFRAQASLRISLVHRSRVRHSLHVLRWITV